MKNIILPLLLFLSVTTYGQTHRKHLLHTDSTTDEHDTHLIVTSVSISSRNLWRGNVYGNNNPSMSGTLAMHLKNHFELGATGTTPLNGSRDGFGIWMELYASHTINRFTFTVDDYYFFNAKDSLNDYFNWNRKDTQHLIETRLRYDSKNGRFNETTSTVLYAATGAVNHAYFEVEYYLIPKIFSVMAGCVLGKSALNFYDKGGVTHFGFTGYRDIVVTKDFTIPLHVSLISSPNYMNASKYPAFTQNPINIVVGIVL